MATPNNGLLAPIAGFLGRRWRGARGGDPSALDELRGILEAAPAAIIAQTPDGRVLAWNRAAARMLGWTNAQLGDPPGSFIPTEARADEVALRQRVLAGNDVFHTPGRFLRADGESLNLLMSAAPRRDAGGKIVGTVIMLEEPVGDRRAAADPAPASEAAHQPGPAAPDPTRDPPRDLGLSQPSRFLAKVGHDLRQPLHALSLLTGALERRVKDPGARELVDDAGTLIRRLQATFDNLVDLARLEEGTVQVQPAAIPVAEILAPLTAEYGREAAKRNVAFRHVESSAMIRTDPLLMQRLLGHLLANAVRFAAREDGARGKVLVGARRSGGQLRLVVADDGGGVPPDQHAVIFEPFVQSEAGRAAGGLGLGLAIAARLARLLDTEIILRSRPGKGSRFSIDVPLEAGDR